MQECTLPLSLSSSSLSFFWPFSCSAGSIKQGQTTNPKTHPCLTLGNENKLAVSPVWCHPLLSCWSRSCLHHGVGSVQCHQHDVVLYSINIPKCCLSSCHKMQLCKNVQMTLSSAALPSIHSANRGLLWITHTSSQSN